MCSTPPSSTHQVIFPKYLRSEMDSQMYVHETYVVERNTISVRDWKANWQLVKYSPLSQVKKSLCVAVELQVYLSVKSFVPSLAACSSGYLGLKNHSSSWKFIQDVPWSFVWGALGMGDITKAWVVATAAWAPAASCISKQFPLPAQPVENSLKTVVNAPILASCDSN